MLVNTVIFANLSVSIDHQNRKLFADRFIYLPRSEQTSEILSVNERQILSGGVLYAENADNSRKSGSQRGPAQSTGRKHGNYHLDFIVELHEL